MSEQNFIRSLSPWDLAGLPGVSDQANVTEALPVCTAGGKRVVLTGFRAQWEQGEGTISVCAAGARVSPRTVLLSEQTSESTFYSSHTPSLRNPAILKGVKTS